MTSTNQPFETIAAVIEGSARAEPAIEASLDEQLKRRLDQVDLLAADLGTIQQFMAIATDYTREAKTELAWNRRIRALSTAFAAVLVVVLIVLFSYAVLGTGWINKAATASTLTAIAVGCISGAVVLTIAVARAAFTAVAERNSGLPMPEQLGALMEALKALTAR